MGRAYGASLGCLALAACIVHGWFMADSPDGILIRGISMLLVFGGVGWIAGTASEIIVRQNLEFSYRAKIERIREANADAKAAQEG